MGDTEDNLAELTLEENDEEPVTIRAEISRHSNSAGEQKYVIEEYKNTRNEPNVDDNVKEVEIETNTDPLETGIGIHTFYLIELMWKKLTF